VSLAILPFRNDSGDRTLDSMGAGLSEVLRTQLGESATVRTVPSDRLHRVMADLQIPVNARLSPADLGRVAEFTNAQRLLWGSITTLGDAVRIDVTLQSMDRGSRTTPLSAMADNRTSPALLAAIGELAGQVREDLASGSANVLAELEKSSWTPSTPSFEALRLYNEGLLLTRQGNHQEALKRFEDATAQDGDFALGYSALARAYWSLRYDNEAQKYSQQAMALAGALPPQEKYTIEANHYRITNKTTEAVAAHENLLKVSPNDTIVLFDLGSLYEQRGEYDKAEQYFTNVVSLDPKFVEGLTALGRVRIRRNNYEGSLEHLNAALTLAIQFGHDEARGNILQAIGIAYKRLGKYDEALKHYNESLEIKRTLDNKGGMAGSLGEIAQVHEAQGRPKEAETSFRRALALQREIGDKSGQSVTLINLATMFQDQGAPDRAMPLLREALTLRREAGNPVGISLVLNNIGGIYLEQGQYSEAQTYLEQALTLREKTGTPGPLADTVHNLAETFSKMGRYDDALRNYLRALDLRRTANDPRGAAIEQYSTGTIFDDQARFGAAVKAKAEALQSLREQKQRDRFLGEAMSGYGASLSRAGRMDAARTSLDEALAFARELDNPSLVAIALRFQAERELLAGDAARAASLAAEAAKAAEAASDRALTLQAQAAVAFVAAATEPSRSLAARFAQLSQEADSLGVRPLAVECVVYRAQTLLAVKDVAAARQDADRAIARALTSGFRLLAAKAHFVRGEALRAAKDASAPRAYAAALRILDEIKAEDGSQDVLKRADLGPMYTTAAQWAR
jgi:tetratricopeptide (TPR) repeat protein